MVQILTETESEEPNAPDTTRVDHRHAQTIENVWCVLPRHNPCISWSLFWSSVFIGFETIALNICMSFEVEAQRIPHFR